MGFFGRDWASEVIPPVPEVKVVGHVDTSPEALTTVVESGIAPASMCFTSLPEAMEATSPDAILVTASLPGHVPSTRAALEAGRHVLVEKPFAPSVAEALELVELAEARGSTLMVSQNYRHFPAVRAVRALVEAGELGTLHAVNVDFRRTPWPRSNQNQNQNRNRPPLTDPLLGDMSIHHFDLMRMLTGLEAREIVCRTWHPDGYGFAGPPSGAALLTFENDLVVSYRGNWISRGPQTAWAGEWSMEFEHGELWWTSRADRADRGVGDAVRLRSTDGEVRELPLPRLDRTDRAGSLTEFQAAVRAGRTPETSGRDNLNSLAMTYAAIRSAAQKTSVELP